MTLALSLVIRSLSGGEYWNWQRGWSQHVERANRIHYVGATEIAAPWEPGEFDWVGDDCYLVKPQCLKLLERLLRNPDDLDTAHNADVAGVALSQDLSPQRILDLCRIVTASERFSPLLPTVDSRICQKRPQWESRKRKRQLKTSVPSLGSTTLLRLPIELLLMVFENLPLSSVLNFFETCPAALALAPKFFTCHPWHSKAIELDASTKPPRWSEWVPKQLNETHIADLDRQWSLALQFRGLVSVYNRLPLEKRFQPYSWPVCWYEFDDSVAIFTYELWGRLYVSGLRIGNSDSQDYEDIGNCHGTYQATLTIPADEAKHLYVAMDEYGIRGLQVGIQRWPPTDQGLQDCYESVSWEEESYVFVFVNDVGLLLSLLRNWTSHH